MNKWKINKTVFESDEINPELSVSPWSGHRQFAYDLTAFCKPQRIVELGTHYGCSFFSFLQACKNEKLSTEVIAIDCWEGDEQAGFYGDEVLNVVKETLNAKFPDQNYRLIKKYFADALSDIEDESADIIHIDGLHTYEAVSEDYRSWLCKLKPNGIMLFHDVASKLGYGTNTFWEEMQNKFSHNYVFKHSWGLGVLFPKGEEIYEIFEKCNMQDKVLIYQYKAMYELEHRQLQDHIVMVQERDRAIESEKKMIDERDDVIKKNEKMIRDKDEVIRKNEEMIRARDEAIKKDEEMIQARDEAIKKDEEMIRARDEIIKKSEEMIREKDEVIKKNEEMILEKDEVLKRNEEIIRANDEALKSSEKLIKEKDEVIKKNEEMIKARDEALRRSEEIIREKDKAFQKGEEMIRARDEAIAANEIMIQERDELIKKMENQLNG